MTQKYRFILILVILLALFNLMNFVIPIHRGAVFWILYGFTTVAFLVMLGAESLAFDKARTLRSAVYGFSIVRVGYIYLFTQLLIWAYINGLANDINFSRSTVAATPVEASLHGLLENLNRSAFGPEYPSWIALTVCSITLAAALVGVIVADASRSFVEGVTTRQQASTLIVRSLRVDAETLAGELKDETLRKQMAQLVEALKYSDPMSSPMLTDIEGELAEKFRLLRTDVAENRNTVATLLSDVALLLDERNRKAKLFKDA